jgi:uncharacterized protein YdhG (YjbR/CyaY superfamily)
MTARRDASRRSTAARKPATIDAYLALLDDDQRAALEELRATIRRAAPRAEECIGYGLPAFRQGRMLVSFGATSRHCAFYLMSSTVLDAFRDELAGRDTSKGTIRFRPDEPLPAALVRRLVRARLAENEALDERVRRPARAAFVRGPRGR